MSRQGKNDAERERDFVFVGLKFSLLLEEWFVSTTMNGSTCCTQLTFYTETYPGRGSDSEIFLYSSEGWPSHD